MKNRRRFVLMIAMLMVLNITGCAGNKVMYEDHLEDYVKTMDYHDGFTILQLSDVHWNLGTQVGDVSYGSERYLNKVIDEAVAHTGGIDLIQINGDTFMLANKLAVKSFVKYMEGTGIPYAINWGNHDRQGKYNPNWLSKQFLTAENSLYTEVDNDNVHERSNYVINLVDEDDRVKWQIFLIDSGASYREGASDIGLTYDYMRESQFEWLSAEHGTVDSSVPVICYYHIPQADSQIAYEAIGAGDTSYKSKFIKHEGFAVSDLAPVTEEVFLRNNVKGVFMAHDHANDWTYTTPSGITYGYGVKSTSELYYTDCASGEEGLGFDVEEDMSLLGASLVTLNDETGDFTLEHLYLNEREEGDFIKWVEY